MIEPTDEMADAVDEVWVGGGNARQAVEAVLALVERDQAGPCQEDLTNNLGDAALHCELRHGHFGDHINGPTTWRRTEPASRWRCNRTERCFREDGHDGRHAFAGAP